MHLAINSGTDLALFNAWLTYIAEQGLDRQGLHRRLDQRLRQGASRPTRPASRRRRKITGLTVDQIRKSAEWIAQPKAGRRAAADHVRLREGPDLGQRQLPHQRRARERGARDRQHRPAGRRLRAHGRPPGRLFAALGRPCRPAGRLRRPAADRGQGRRASHLGLRPLQDDAQRAASSSRPTRSAPTW